MRLDMRRKRLWLVTGVMAVAAVVVTGASAVSSSGTITTFAGNGKLPSSGYSVGGEAMSARIVPRGVAVDRLGNVYIGADSRVLKVSVRGTITTFAGTGKPGNTGDGGPATAAQLFESDWVAADGKGN